MNGKLICSCGGAEEKNHTLGEGNCFRKEATGKLIPINFRKEPLLHAHSRPVDVCDVNGYTITEYTLRNQRLYSEHPNGRWSLPKGEESTNSLEGNW